MANNSFVIIQTADSRGLKLIMTRLKTDQFFILLLPFYFLLWLGICIYELLPGNYLNSKLDLGSILLKSLANITIYTVVSVIIVIAFLFITTALKARWIVLTAISLIVITIISYITLIQWDLSVLFIFSVSTKSPSVLFLFVCLTVIVLFFIYQVTIYVCTKETDVNLTAELIIKSFSAILESWDAALFYLVIAFSSIIVLMITINISMSRIFEYVDSQTNFNVPVNPNYLGLLRLTIFFIGGINTFNFIWNFGFTVTSDYFAHFYARSDDEKLVSGTSISKSISRVGRYHLGTVAFLSVPILPSICALTMAFKTNQQQQQFSVNKASYVSVSFFSKICLVLDISDYALIQTAINGYKSLKSISEMFELQRRSSLLFLTLNAISSKVIEICIILATIIGMIIRLSSLDEYHDFPLLYLNNSEYDKLVFFEVIVAAIYINFICKSVTRSALCTNFTIYLMTSTRKSEATMEDPIAIAEQSM